MTDLDNINLINLPKSESFSNLSLDRNDKSLYTCNQPLDLPNQNTYSALLYTKIEDKNLKATLEISENNKNLTIKTNEETRVFDFSDDVIVARNLMSGRLQTTPENGYHISCLKLEKARQTKIISEGNSDINRTVSLNHSSSKVSLASLGSKASIISKITSSAITTDTNSLDSELLNYDIKDHKERCLVIDIIYKYKPYYFLIDKDQPKASEIARHLNNITKKWEKVMQDFGGYDFLFKAATEVKFNLEEKCQPEDSVRIGKLKKVLKQYNFTNEMISKVITEDMEKDDSIRFETFQKSLKELHFDADLKHLFYDQDHFVDDSKTHGTQGDSIFRRGYNRFRNIKTNINLLTKNLHKAQSRCPTNFEIILKTQNDPSNNIMVPKALTAMNFGYENRFFDLKFNQTDLSRSKSTSKRKNNSNSSYEQAIFKQIDKHQHKNDDQEFDLSKYYIASSHNTYILSQGTLGQLKGETSACGYRIALERNCRFLELDCWDGDDDTHLENMPVITHAHPTLGDTMCKKIPLEDVIMVITDFCKTKQALNQDFTPIILTLDNKILNLENDRKMALIMRKYFGEFLYLGPEHESSRDRWPTLSELMNKIIIRGKLTTGKRHPELIAITTMPTNGFLTSKHKEICDKMLAKNKGSHQK